MSRTAQVRERRSWNCHHAPIHASVLDAVSRVHVTSINSDRKGEAYTRGLSQRRRSVKVCRLGKSKAVCRDPDRTSVLTTKLSAVKSQKASGEAISLTSKRRLLGFSASSPTAKRSSGAVRRSRGRRTKI